MVEYFDEPKEITIKELRESDDYYIQKVMYGDFDNWVTVIIKDVIFRNKDFRKFEEDCGIFKKGDFVVTKTTETVYVAEADMKGIKNAKVEIMCSINPIILRSVEDIDNIKVRVYGIWKEEA